MLNPKPWEGWGNESKGVVGALRHCRAMRLSDKQSSRLCADRLRAEFRRRPCSMRNAKGVSRLGLSCYRVAGLCCRGRNRQCPRQFGSRRSIHEKLPHHKWMETGTARSGSCCRGRGSLRQNADAVWHRTSAWELDQHRSAGLVRRKQEVRCGR